MVETAPVGGLLHFAAQFADALAERGHSVDLIAPRGNELAAHAGPARRKAILVPTVPLDDVVPRGRVRMALRRVAIAARFSVSWLRIIRAVRRADYDVIILNADFFVSVPAVGAMALTLLRGRAAVVDVCHEVRLIGRRSESSMLASAPVLSALLRAVYRRTALVFVLGERSRAEFEAVWPGVPVAVIPHGDERIFASRPPAPADEERALFFGYWRRVKGLPVLMSAFDRLLKRRPSVRLTIAGMPHAEEADVDEVERWAASHGERVDLIARYVTMEEVPQVFGAARVVVTPYLHATQSGIVYLAMTMGRPVVSSDIGDLGEAVIDGRTGYLVPPGDADALADALERVLADPAAAERMGREAHERVLATAGWERVAEAAEGPLEEVVRRR